MPCSEARYILRAEFMPDGYGTVSCLKKRYFILANKGRLAETVVTTATSNRAANPKKHSHTHGGKASAMAWSYGRCEAMWCLVGLE